MTNRSFTRPALLVKKPGQLSLLQDFGRYGVTQWGITSGGAVDSYSYGWANHLLNNPPHSAALEITLGQAEFMAQATCQLALCGGDLQAKLDDEIVSNWSVFTMRQGQTLRFGLPKNGLRAYLAIKGGFDVSPQLGSRATVVKDKLGGLQSDGQPLQAGDILPFHTHHCEQPPRQVASRFQPDYNQPVTLRVIESYQHDLFTPEAKATLYAQSFQVSQHCNRMGYRLSGQPITPPQQPILSEGIALGAIQIPPDGQPIVLLNDRQTIGGYPKLGCVARVDLPRLAQAKPGQQVQFEQGDLLQLQKLWCQWATFFGY